MKSGELGLGKTLIVEVVAEHRKRALYLVSFTFLYPLIPSLII
jgi:MoxR-like ATPase